MSTKVLQSNGTHTMMTADQRSALRDPGAFAIKTLKALQRDCCKEGLTRDDLWRTINFAVFDIKLADARRKAAAKRK